MDRSDCIYLISRTYTTDELMKRIPVETKRMVYCNTDSITRTEWDAAGRLGLQPAFRFTMFAPDYQGEKIVEYKGQRYGVYRTYRSTNERLELYVEEKGGLYVE